VKLIKGLPDEWDACSRTISFEGPPSALACRGDIIAVGLRSNNVVILDAITGSTVYTLSGHTNVVSSLAFSLDGTFLVSGSEDKTVKLWDVQTGGAIKTFGGHSSTISSVSISPDRALIVSGSHDGTIRLWDVRTGKRCHAVIRHSSEVTTVSFPPTDSQRLISSFADGAVRQWDIDGLRDGLLCRDAVTATHVAYSLDGTRFVSCGGTVATVRYSESGAEVAKLHAAERTFQCGCFSPNGRLVACAAGDAIYVWDIAGPEPRLVGNFFGHTGDVISIVFSSSLITGSNDRSVKFWKTRASEMVTDPVATDYRPTLLTSAAIESVSLSPKHDVAATSDSSGIVTWDTTTGARRSHFSTSAKGTRGTYLADGTLVVVWYEWTGGPEGKYVIWDIAGTGHLLREVGWSRTKPLDLRMSGDGSKLFVLQDRSLQVWSTKTGKDIYAIVWGGASMERPKGPLIVHGSKVWTTCRGSTGWDFETQPPSPLPPYNEFPGRPRLDFVDWSTGDGVRTGIQDIITGTLVFRFPERYVKPFAKARWDGRYLIVGYPSGEVIIMDFIRVHPPSTPQEVHAVPSQMARFEAPGSRLSV